MQLEYKSKGNVQIDMAKNKLELTNIAGTQLQAGENYGEIFRTALGGFLHSEVAPSSSRIEYAKSCWKTIEKYAPASAEFMRGISRGSKLTLPEVALLSLHEEINHQTHCTAFGATGSGSSGGRALLAQNWDWKTWRYPWPGLLRLRITGAPRLLTYHYPGLWASLGINQYGLSLMWTGGGYWPRLTPKIGVPTYALIYDLLLRKTVEEALAYLQQNRHAGCFLFFLGDAKGNIAVVEGIPGHVEIDQNSERLSRANHFECPLVIAKTGQKLPSNKQSNSSLRSHRAQLYLKNAGRKNSVASMKHHLTRDPEIYRYSALHMTIDSFVADCKRRVLHVARGGPTPGPWRNYEV